MKDKLINFIITRAVEAIMSSMSQEQVKRSLDKLIDHLEELVLESENKFDDNILPFMRFIRETLDVPDYPDV